MTVLTAHPRRLMLGVVILVACLAFAARVIPSPRTIDDAFITFRYSRNILEGKGFTYNPGTPVLGTTTPFFTLLVAGVGAVLNGRDFPTYALVLSALADALTAVLLIHIVRRLTGHPLPSLLIGVLWAVAPRSVTFAVGGMETSFAILWMVAAVYTYLTERPLWLGFFAGLGLFTRIDAALWIAPLFAHQALLSLRERPPLRLALRTWLVTALTIAPWVVFSLAYFGSPVPRSLAAKSVAYVVAPGSALITFIQAFSEPFFEFETFGSLGAMVGAVVYFTLALIGVLYGVRRQPRLLPFFLYPFLYVLVFSLANPLIFRWYLAPPMPAYMILILCGVWALVGGWGKRPTFVGQARRFVFVGAACLWLFTSLRGWTLHPDHGADRPAPIMAWHQIERYYREMVEYLRATYGISETTRLAAGDIGAVGYFSGAIIVDTVGLVTPAMSAYYPVDPALIPPGQVYAIPPQLIRDTQPDYLLTMEAFIRLGVAQDPTFQRDYELIREIPTTFYGTGMLLYKRR
ncbi:MAG: hypothetical protein HS103_08860 [Anaerolineales bacterium]|nr:hypothetical protein [Anaerolineales bacterium]